MPFLSSGQVGLRRWAQSGTGFFWPPPMAGSSTVCSGTGSGPATCKGAGTPEEPEARQIVKAALPALDAGAEWIRADQDFPPRQAGTLDRLKSGPVNALFYRFFVHDGPFRSTDACVGCGKCAERCVLGDIRMEAGRPVWSGKCTHCMACICGCPTGAIEYGRSSRGRPRYQCPEE